MESNTKDNGLILVIGATGKTGRRVADRLEARGLRVRRGSRGASPAFDWDEPATWPAALEGVTAAYVSYAPDLAAPAAPGAIRAFTELAGTLGVRHLVLLSGRGEEEAQRSERIVQDSGIAWTIVRASWFNQNFSEGAFRDMILSGTVALPAGDIGEPFVDVDDIADVAVAALTEPGHAGRLYEVTGPRLMTFRETVAEIARASGRSVAYVQITPAQFVEGLAALGLPEDVIGLLNYLFTEVLDGRNAHVTHGVREALGREPRDFSRFADDAAAADAWRGEAVTS